jgi:hypothetical protein
MGRIIRLAGLLCGTVCCLQFANAAASAGWASLFCLGKTTNTNFLAAGNSVSHADIVYRCNDVRHGESNDH